MTYAMAIFMALVSCALVRPAVAEGQTQGLPTVNVAEDHRYKKLAKAFVEVDHATVLNAAEHMAAGLQGQIAHSKHVRHQLRKRLDEVTLEAHENFHALLSELEVAKAAAQRMEDNLKAQVQHGSSELASAAQVQTKLRAQLAAVEKAEATERNAAASDEAKLRAELAVAKTTQGQAAAKLVAEGQAEDQLRVQVTAATKERTLLRAKLTAAGKANDQQKASLKAAALEKSKVQSKLKVESKAASDVATKLAAELHVESELRENITHTLVTEKFDVSVAHRDHIALLNQIADLQEDTQQAAKRAFAAEAKMHLADAEASKEVAAQVAVAKEQAKQKEANFAALQKTSKSADSKLQTAMSDAAAARKEATALSAVADKKGQDLHSALIETSDLRAARDAAAKGEAALQQQNDVAESALDQSHSEVAEAKRQLEQMKEKVAANNAQTEEARKSAAEEDKRLAAVKAADQAAEKRSAGEVRETMVSAASKVHDLENQRNSLDKQLKSDKKALEASTEQAANVKDSLLQQTDTALKATQRADDLSESLAAAQKASEQNAAKAASLQNVVSGLGSVRKSLLKEVAARTAEVEDLRAKADRLESQVDLASGKAKTIEAQNLQLRSQVSDLSSEGQRADELSSQLSALSEVVQKNASQLAALQREMEMTRELKERYSLEYEEQRNVSQTRHTRADDLSTELQAVAKKLNTVGNQRDMALKHAKDARAQEDEYFEENTKLEQQGEALKTQLATASAASEHSSDDEKALETRVEAVTAERAQEQQSSHAAWVANEQTLMDTRHDLKVATMLKATTQAELTRTLAVLADSQRKTLGLDVDTKSAADAKGAVKTTQPGHVAVPVALRTQRPGSAPEPPLTPEVAHLKVWAMSAKAAHLPNRFAATRTARLTPTPTAKPVPPLPAAPVPSPLAAAQSRLPGEPLRPNDDAAATLASVSAPSVSAPSVSVPVLPMPSPAEYSEYPTSVSAMSSRSTLQKLAEYFATPVIH